MHVRRITRNWVARPWLLWVAVIACLFLASNARATLTPSAKLQQIALDWRGLGYPVLCENDQVAWNAAYPPPAGSGIYLGFTNRTTHEVKLAPSVCLGLETDNPSGQAVLVFLHELYHSVGIVDEAQAECMALGNLYQFVHAYYQPDQYKAMEMVNSAWDWHRTTPSSYQPAWCRPPNWVTSPSIIRTSSTVLRTIRKCYVRTKTHKLKTIKCPPRR